VQTPLPAVRFAKGHGTQNDFVLLPDAGGAFDPTPEQVAALCDRRAGIGGDGLIRAVPATALDAGRGLAAEWFMDYRNADGSVAEMCGNGLRVFVAYLEHLGWVRLADGEEIAVGTRAGVKRVRRDGGLLAADLGSWIVAGGAEAVEAGSDVLVGVAGERTHRTSSGCGTPTCGPRRRSIRCRRTARTSSWWSRCTCLVAGRRPAPRATWRCGCTSAAWARPGPAGRARWRRSSPRGRGAVRVRRTRGGSTSLAAGCA
jgi:hypothetical protein